VERNVPTLLNIGLHKALFWDGRTGSLEDQALVPIKDPREMNQDLDELEAELNEVAGYRSQFREAFGTDVTRNGIAKAIAVFERSLVSGPAPLDRYLAGDEDALSHEARHGLELFVGEADCVRCHSGPLLSDGQFYRLGIAGDDPGRAAITGSDVDRGKFRTPSLRNVALTAPYMHDGSRRLCTRWSSFIYEECPHTRRTTCPSMWSRS
jgi:cytochrome c peroxidase